MRKHVPWRVCACSFPRVLVSSFLFERGQVSHWKASTGRGHGQLPQSHYQVSPAYSLSFWLTVHPFPSLPPTHSLSSRAACKDTQEERMFEKLYSLSFLKPQVCCAIEAIVHVIYQSTNTFVGKPNHRNNRSEESILTCPRCQLVATTGTSRLC